MSEHDNEPSPTTQGLRLPEHTNTQVRVGDALNDARRECDSARAIIDFILSCIEGDRFKDSMGQTAEWYVGYALGTAGHAYHAASFVDLNDENERLRGALQRIADQGPELTDNWKHWRQIARDALGEHSKTNASRSTDA